MSKDINHQKNFFHIKWRWFHINQAVDGEPPKIGWRLRSAGSYSQQASAVGESGVKPKQRKRSREKGVAGKSVEEMEGQGWQLVTSFITRWNIMELFRLSLTKGQAHLGTLSVVVSCL